MAVKRPAEQQLAPSAFGSPELRQNEALHLEQEMAAVARKASVSERES